MNRQTAGYVAALALMIGSPFATMGVPALRFTYNAIAAPSTVGASAPVVSRGECLLGGSGLLLGDIVALGTLAASRRKRPGLSL
jgi:hypothetical protein